MCICHQRVVRVAHVHVTQVAGTRIRLYGMDAPEKAQLCKTKAGQDYPCGM